MKHHRRKIALLSAAVILSLAATGRPQSRQVAVDQYREAYLVLQDALKLSYEKRKEEALTRYEEARDKLRNLLEKFPEINRNTIEVRIAKCEEEIERLKREISTSLPPAEDPIAVTEKPPLMPPAVTEIGGIEGESEKLKMEVGDLSEKLKSVSTDLNKTKTDKVTIEADLQKAREETERMQQEIQNLNTSLAMAITDLDKERENKAKIEEEAVKANQASEEILKSQLGQAIEDKKRLESEQQRIEGEALNAYQASEEIMRKMMERQRQEHLQDLAAEMERCKSERDATARPVEKLQVDIDAYLQQLEQAREGLNENIKMIASSQETHKKLLKANRAIEERIALLSKSVSDTETEAELSELRKIATAEEERLKKPDVTRDPFLPKKVLPSESQVLVGEISEKNDEYGKVFIDFDQEVAEGEELVVLRDNEAVATLTVSKVFPSIKGGIANVVPKEDAYELREKDKVFAVRKDQK